MTLASSLDFQLLFYLYASVRPRGWAGTGPPLILQVSSYAGLSTLNPAGVAHLAQYLSSQGFPVEAVNLAQCT